MAVCERAISGTIRAAGAGLKIACQLQITGAVLGERPANSIRSRNFPKPGEILGAAAMVGSKAPAIVGVHDPGLLFRFAGVGGGDPSAGAGVAPRDCSGAECTRNDDAAGWAVAGVKCREFAGEAWLAEYSRVSGSSPASGIYFPQSGTKSRVRRLLC